MKQVIFSNWNFMRFLRLVLGIAIVVRSAMADNWAMGMLGLVFSSMAVFDIGCCGTAGCKPAARKISQPAKDITYVEVV